MECLQDKMEKRKDLTRKKRLRKERTALGREKERKEGRKKGSVHTCFRTYATNTIMNKATILHILPY